MNKGYIKLWRSIADNDLYFSEPFTKTQAWIDLLILANHKPNNIDVRGNLVFVDRGQVAAGEEFLAKRWKWSRNKVRRYLDMLQNRGQTKQQKSRILSIYTILNWELYQGNDTTDDTTERQQKDNRRTTPKNDKNVENEKKEPPNPQRGDVSALQSEFLSRFNSATGKKHRVLDAKAAGQLKARLRDGFTLDEIITAAGNCSKDEHHRESGLKYLTPEFITRADKLQMHLHAKTERKSTL